MALGSWHRSVGCGTIGPVSIYGSGAWGGLGGQSLVSTSARVAQAVNTDGLVAVGDSISVASFPDLAGDLFAADGSITGVDARNSAPAWYGIDRLEQIAAQVGLPNRVLIALGSNDIFDPPAFVGQIDRALAVCGDTRWVYWVTVQAARPATALADQRNSGWINAELAKATARHPNLRLIEWHSFLARKLSRLSVYVSSDGVHPTVEGIAARNAMIVATLARA